MTNNIKEGIFSIYRRI